MPSTLTSSTSLGCVDHAEFGDGDRAVAGGAGAGQGYEQELESVDGGVEGLAGAGAFGSSRRRVVKAWARVTRVTWRFQPVWVRPSKWARPGPCLSSR